jgi:hypothetical protein
VTDHSCNSVCLQETKLQVVDDPIIATTLGQAFLSNYATLPAIGTRGGTILACFQDLFAMSLVEVRPHSVIATIMHTTDNEAWTVTGIYVPRMTMTDVISIRDEINQADNKLQLDHLGRF